MHLLFPFILFIITFAGGSIPIWLKGIDDKRMHLLLAFSGSFLLSITFLHLLPETFTELGNTAGLLLLAGFFLQLILQRFTHGIEHGHVHLHSQTHSHTHENDSHSHNNHHHNSSAPVFSIMLGLTLHAFMEGLPLGFNYRMAATEPSLYLAVAAHKLPEAMLVTSLVVNSKSRKNTFAILLLFSLITPFAGIIATQLGTGYHTIARTVVVLIPVVAGAFIHIATTIFFESGTRHHMLTMQKILAIIAGMGIGLATLLFE